jgi:2-oxoglutarate ferredoxin oxidoreductase subunit alpha
MNDWMCPVLKWDESYQPDRGKVLSKEQIVQLEKFQRFVDKDGDGIAARTLPGVHPKGAFFTRGSGHNQYGGYTEDAAEYQLVLDRLKRKHDTAKGLVPKAVITGRTGAHDAGHDIGIVSIGSCDGAINEALDILKRRGIHLDYMRVRGFPFGAEVEEFLAAHSLLFVVEQNRDAQFRSLLTLETAVEKAKLRSILHYSGLPISSVCIVEGVVTELSRNKRLVELQSLRTALPN